MKKTVLILFLTLLIAITCATCWNVYHYSHQRAELKRDISTVNDVLYGLLSVNKWKDNMRNIAVKQVEEFKLSPEQDSLIRVSIDDVLRGLITKTDKVIQNDDGTILKFLRKQAINLFFDVDDFKKDIPKFTNVIMKKLTSEDGKKRLKQLVLSKLDELAAMTYDSVNVREYNQYLSKYNAKDKADFNKITERKVGRLYNATFDNSLFPIIITFIFIALWILYRKELEYRHILIGFSILFGVIILLTGVSSPMIEIDARFREMTFVLLGEKINFSNQFLFYRSKSILEIISIMLDTGKIASVLVALLILSFSVLLPFAKLISMSIYLISTKYRKYKFTDWITFKSGKWSMADVMVVAIFMAYVAFHSILDNQLEGLNRSSESLTAITTNHTSLEPGFYIFVTYVLFSILLSSYLSKTIEKETKD